MSDFWIVFDSIMLLEIDTTFNNPGSTQRCEACFNMSKQHYVSVSGDKGIIHGDNVNYIHGNHL